MTKVCTKCGVEKSLGDFYTYGCGRWYKGSCKACTIAHNNIGQNEYRARNPERRKAWNRRGRLKYAFGLTPTDYERMLAAQGGGCAICGAPNGSDCRNHPVDHDHSTGAIRGILCIRCNRALGLLRDDPTRFQNAIDYLAGPAVASGTTSMLMFC